VAVVESIVFLLAINIELMQASLSRILISGGLSSLDGLCRKLANVSSMQVERGEDTETTARGVAWLAAGCPSGWFDREACTVFVPEDDPGLIRRYRRFRDTLQHALEADTRHVINRR
jgi:glycerol kinase